jgi:polygalacturonase
VAIALAFFAHNGFAVDEVDVCDHGAHPDGKTLCTAGIQKAIDACSAGGGGTVRFPAGTYLTGSLRLRSGITLQLEEGAILLGSRDRDDYYLLPPDSPGAGDRQDLVFCHLIHGEGLRDIGIRGPGTIDGSGSAFRDKTKKRTKAIYFVNCRNVVVEDVRLRNAGSWMQHYRLCRNVKIRNIDVFNHVAFNNDGLNIDSCQDVEITGCRVDSDDDGIVLKSLSETPCRNVKITDCTVSSHCNGLKMGTESGGGFIDITISDCRVSSPAHSQKIYGRQRGLAGVALEIVDGGTMENVTVRDVAIKGVSVPIFLRLGNRARPYVAGSQPGVGTLRNVRLSNISAVGTGVIGCSITGLPGHPVESVTIENVRLAFDGGGTREDAAREIPEREKSYPESTMFGTLPAYGFYCRHAKGLTFTNVQLKTDRPDRRHAMVFDDVRELRIVGIDAQFWSGGAPLLRLTQVRGAVINVPSPREPVDTLLHLQGDATSGVVLEKADFDKVRKVVEASDEVSDDSFKIDS